MIAKRNVRFKSLLLSIMFCNHALSNQLCLPGDLEPNIPPKTAANSTSLITTTDIINVFVLQDPAKTIQVCNLARK